jgi:Caenorhabditis protein of unknown function, DUF268
LLSAVHGWRRYVSDRSTFRRMAGAGAMAWGDEQPMLTEWEESSGSLGPYFYQDLTVAKWIRGDAPSRHVDVGSRLDGFIGNLACFREVEVIDIRPAPAEIPGVRFHQMDLMNELPVEWLQCTDSLSCLHTIEHFGLGRYGDPVNVNGHLQGLARLKQMVAPGGMIYLSTPIGPERIEFNAHRVFAARTLIDWFGDGWEIEKFAVIDDRIRIHENVDWLGPEVIGHFGCNLGVGIVAARKIR